MIYALLANLVLAAHLAFVLFGALGGLFALRWRWVPWMHLPAVAWGAFVEISGGICPLTPLENWLRHAAGGTGYEEGFVEHYLVSLLYPAALTRGLQYALASLLLALNAAIYAIVWRRHRRARASERGAVR